MDRISHAVLFAAMLALAGSGCSKKSPGAAPAVETTDTPRMTPTEFAASVPKVGGPAGYIGAESCKACHEDQFSSWHRSYHRTMTQLADGGAVQADFDDVTLTNESTRFLLGAKADEHWVRMERIGSTNEAVEARVGLVTGSHHMQVF